MTKTASTRRRRPNAFDPVVAAIGAQLCAVTESRSVRMRHVAALLAYAPQIQRTGDQMRFEYGHGSTAAWVSEALPASEVGVEDCGDAGGAVIVTTPEMVLADFGFRGDRWIFGVGIDAALGISRGAVHAASALNKRGLTVACPNTPMMLTLAAVMARLGLTAMPTGGQPRVTVGAGDVTGALDRLGIAAIAQDYLRIRDGAATKGKS